MNNELIFFLSAGLGIGGALFFFKLGRVWLTVYISFLLIMANLVEPKAFDFFGFPATPGSMLFAALMFSTDLLAERYGRWVALRAVNIAFVLQCFFFVFVYLVTQLEPLPFAEGLASAMDETLGGSLRIILASLIAYVIWANYDVWMYDLIHRKTGKKHLWLRNNLSTMTSQIGNSFTFFFLAFYGVAPDWLDLALVALGFYLVFALLDTFFIYLSRLITPMDENNPETQI